MTVSECFVKKINNFLKKIYPLVDSEVCLVDSESGTPHPAPSLDACVTVQKCSSMAVLEENQGHNSLPPDAKGF